VQEFFTLALPVGSFKECPGTEDGFGARSVWLGIFITVGDVAMGVILVFLMKAKEKDS